MPSTNCINATGNELSSTQHGSAVGVLLASLVEMILFLVGTFGNSLTIMVVCRTKSLQIASNFLLTSLAFADLLVSFILVPMRASQHMALYHGTTVPKAVVQVAGFVGRVNIIASISSLVAMSIDRYIALSRPMFYLSSIRFAKGRVYLVIMMIWAVSIFATSLPSFPGVSSETFLVFFVAFVLIATLAIAVTYQRIFKIARKSIRRPKTRKFATKVVRLSITNALDSRVFSYFDSTCTTQADRHADSQKRERKTAKTIAFVIGAFVILVYPRIILILYHFATPETGESKHVRFWIRILLYSNSVVNPGLYAWRHKEFKREFKKILLRFWQCLLCQKWEHLRKSWSGKTNSTSAPQNRESIHKQDVRLKTIEVNEV